MWLQRIWLRLMLAGLACCLTSQFGPSQDLLINNRLPAYLGPPEEPRSKLTETPSPPDLLIFIPSKAIASFIDIEPEKPPIPVIVLRHTLEPGEAIVPSVAAIEVGLTPLRALLSVPDLAIETPSLSLPVVRQELTPVVFERPAFGRAVGVTRVVEVAMPERMLPPLKLGLTTTAARFDRPEAAPIEEANPEPVPQWYRVDSEEAWRERLQPNAMPSFTPRYNIPPYPVMPQRRPIEYPLLDRLGCGWIASSALEVQLFFADNLPWR